MVTIQEYTSKNVGDYIKFGSYPQTVKGIVRPIEWQVLLKEENKMLIISRYGLDTRRFNIFKKMDFNSHSNDWKNSEIRQWLNSDFYNKTFDENEKKYINSFDSDNVFLLSVEELEKYFANDKARKCKATKYAVKNGALGYHDHGYWWLRPSHPHHSDWWLRSPHPNIGNCVYTVTSDGSVGCCSVDYDKNLVRPALWIKL